MATEHRPLGRTGLSVHPICLGGNVFGWTADERASFEVLDAYVERGGNFIDTAESYSAWVPGHQGGESETVIGRWLAARPGMRERVIIATKVGPPLGAARVREACEGSLRRLGIDSVDVYYAHRFDTDTPLEETLEAFDTLVREGKVRVIASSNHSATQLEQALGVSQSHGWAAYGAEQPPYSLMNRSLEGELGSFCASRGIGVVGYAALAGGFLSGKYTEGGEAPPTARAAAVAQRYQNPRGWRIVTALRALGSEVGATPAQVALAWVLHKPELLVGPIASATSAAQLHELMDACEVRLDDAAMRRLDEASAPED